MQDISSLKDIITRQKKALTDLENTCYKIEGKDLNKENEQLKSELEKITSSFSSTKEKLSLLNDENSKLKNALYTQVYNEKVMILKASQEKIDIFFKNNHQGESNRLILLENDVKKRILTMTNTLKTNRINLNDNIYKELNHLEDLLYERVTLAKKQADADTSTLYRNTKQQFEALKNEQVTDTMIKESAKKKNIESFVGLSLLNKLGMLLIIIGVIIASQYTYFLLSDQIKAIMIFILGGGLLLVGEFLSRKKSNVFSLGLTAGGVSILYIALVSSYFGFKILSVYPAIGLCILITAGAFLLATRYNAQVILIFALIGGYLPVIAIESDPLLLYAAMAYFVVLNLLALLVAFQKKWIVASYIGLFLNIAGSIYISTKAQNLVPILTILYVLFAFVIYTLIPIISTYREKSLFKKADVFLIAINIFFSSILIYRVFYVLNLSDYNGLLAIVLAATYILLARLIESKFKQEKQMDILFYLTGFVFVVLVVPLQFGIQWLCIGWMIEATVILIYGILKNEKTFQIIGSIIGGLCLASFVIFDLISIGYSTLFPYKYFALTLSTLLILSAFTYKKMLTGSFEKNFKYLTIINLWFYSVYFIKWQLLNDLTLLQLSTDYLCNALAITVTFLIAFIVPRIKILCDKGIQIITIVLYAIGIFWLFILNQMYSPFMLPLSDVAPLEFIFGTIILVVISLLSVGVVYDLLRQCVLERKIGVQWFPMFLSAYLVLILTQNLISQYQLSFSSVIISIIYVVTAFTWIVFGFIKRYSFLRQFGLFLAIFAVLKLFLLDLSTLTTGYKIISYFALGITLLGISFVYQYFNKRLELTAVIIDDKKDN